MAALRDVHEDCDLRLLRCTDNDEGDSFARRVWHSILPVRSLPHAFARCFAEHVALSANDNRQNQRLDRPLHAEARTKTFKRRAPSGGYTSLIV